MLRKKISFQNRATIDMENPMKTNIKISLFVCAIATTQSILSDYIITFFMRPYPYLPETEKKITKEEAQIKSAKLKKPGKIAKYTLRSILQSNIASGIFCTYSGQLEISDQDGQVTFARRQESPNVKLLITNRVTPILMGGQTIHHWEIEGGSPARLYYVNQREDEETNIEFWDVKKIKLPANNRISLDTIIIFAKPSHIFVPEGITQIEKDTQLILPDIYVKKNIDKLSNSFYVLNLKRFFSQTKEQYQIKEKEYSVQTQG